MIFGLVALELTAGPSSITEGLGATVAVPAVALLIAPGAVALDAAPGAVALDAAPGAVALDAAPGAVAGCCTGRVALYVAGWSADTLAWKVCAFSQCCA